MALIPQYSPGATPLSLDESQALIPSFVTTQAALNEFEQANIIKGAQWAYKSRQDILAEKFILGLHKHMFDATWRWAGKYRVSDKNIGCSYWDIPVRVAELIKNTQVQIESQSMSPDEIAVRFHHRLVSIHPFPNGNGRHSRLMADLLIVRLGDEPFSWGGNIDLVSPSETRSLYLSALRAADARDIEPLLAFARS
ncbi:MAG: mobile mystery protein B [Spirochaetota bacterium]